MNERIATDTRFYRRVISILVATSIEIAECVKIRGTTIILPQLSHPWRQPLRQYIINSHLFKYWFYLTYYKKKQKQVRFSVRSLIFSLQYPLIQKSLRVFILNYFMKIRLSLYYTCVYVLIHTLHTFLRISSLTGSLYNFSQNRIQQ